MTKKCDDKVKKKDKKICEKILEEDSDNKNEHPEIKKIKDACKSLKEKK